MTFHWIEKHRSIGPVQYRLHRGAAHLGHAALDLFSCGYVGHLKMTGEVVRADTLEACQKLLINRAEAWFVSASAPYDVLLREKDAEIQRLRARCTCDDHCDSPCPIHARENDLQDRWLLCREALREASSYVTNDALRKRIDILVGNVIPLPTLISERSDNEL